MSFGDNKMDSVSLTFDSEHFDTIAGAFLALYGPATTREQQTVQNRMRASLLNDKLVWQGQQVSISLQKYGSKVTQSSAWLTTKEGAERFQKKVRERVEKAKEGLR